MSGINMRRSNMYSRSSLVPTLGFIALFLFALNFHTAFSRHWDDWSMHRPKCRTAHAGMFEHRVRASTVDMQEIERGIEQEMARAEREIARAERELRHMEHSFVPPAPPPPPKPPRIVIVR